MVLVKLIKRFCRFIIGLLKYMPSKPAMCLRNLCYRIVLKNMGKDSNIADGVTITNPSLVSIGKNTSINEYTYIGSKGEVSIGDYVMVGTDCSIISDAHNFSDKNILIKEQGVSPLPVEIGNNVWLGCKVTILGKVKIGNGAIIGAGSVVTKDIPDNAIAYGVPCQVKRIR